MDDEVTRVDPQGHPPSPATAPVAATSDVETTLNLNDEAALATGAPEVSREGDQVIIDLRELAPTGRRLPGGPGMCGRPPTISEHHHYFMISGGDRWMEAESFVYDVYRELGYTKESSTRQVEELAQFADNSRFHAIEDGDGRIIGTTRAIFGSFDELPVGRFERTDFTDADPMCELSSIVVDPRARSTGIIEHLYRAGWADGLRSGANAIAGVGEDWLLATFRNTYGLPFVPIGVPEYYMGGPVIPMLMSTGPEAAAEISRVNSEFWGWSLEALTDSEIDSLGYGPTVPSASRPG